MRPIDAYRKAMRGLSPRLSPSMLSKINNEMEQHLTGAPQSAFSIPESVLHDPHPLRQGSPGAVMRSIGLSRRVFLLHSSLTPVEIDGLAYRIRALSSNGGINSIVLANPLEDVECNGDMSDNQTCLPMYLDEGHIDQFNRVRPDRTWGKNRQHFVKAMMDEHFGDELGMPYVSMGYDATNVYKKGLYNDMPSLERELMVPLIHLSLAIRGNFEESIDNTGSRVPVITVPHGLITDSGYALLSGSYALATYSTSFRILNPLRGLAFDPVGLSYLLPRVGVEFAQTAVAKHSAGCAFLLALTGYEANGADLVSTGLATHYIGSPYKLNILERALTEINSFEGQALQPSPKTLYGHQNNMWQPDINQQYKNVAVANLIQCLTDYDAAGADEYGCFLRSELDDEHQLFLKDNDPSLTMQEDRTRMYGAIVSPLVNWAATFGSVWEETSVEGMMERLREIGDTKVDYEGKSGFEEDVAVAEQAQYLVSCMEQRSPLALAVMHQLLLRGSEKGETIMSCMIREKESQMKLFSKEDGDFLRWAKSGQGVGLTSMDGHASLIRENEGVYSGWNHKSIKEVTNDEVMEIVGN